jgi:hypothetical protein
MKPVLYAISAFVALSFASSSALAYSGSECEVNDCSKPSSSKAKSNSTTSQPKTKAELKADVKNEAKSQAKAKVLEKTPSPLRDVAGFFK